VHPQRALNIISGRACHPSRSGTIRAVDSSRVILHVDMDAFFASVEQRDRPELRGRPVLVGGAGPRGVVAAASYEARVFGCRSAQPMAVARRLCPGAIIVPPDGARYREASRRVFAILDRYTPLVEPLSVDEAFLDVSGSQRLHGPAPRIAASIKAAIRAEVSLTASIGVGPNKFLAKLASDLEKPDGLVVIDPAWIEARLPHLEIGRMWGVGPATEARLARLGVHRFGDLAAAADRVRACFGADAQRLLRLARGEDDRPVEVEHAARSISHEHTFGVDEADPRAARDVLLGQVEAVARRLRRAGLAARTVSIKLRFGDYRTITRGRTLEDPLDATDGLWAVASGIFDGWAAAGYRPLRLIGAGASGLCPAGGPVGLFEAEEAERRRRLDRVSDQIYARFGPAGLHRGA
jgi:DNA polymerase-4